MKKSSFLYISLALITLLWVLNSLAATFSFYWIYGWYDYMMHFLGGFSLAFFFVYFTRSLSKKSLIYIFVAVVIAGGLWEIFEYTHGLTQSTEGYTLDTVHDLASDAVGAVVALYLIARKRESSSKFQDA